MKIMVSAYLDRNFGDDMFIFMLANELQQDDIYLNLEDNSILMLPFEELTNIHPYKLSKNPFKRLKQLREFDACIKIGGSMFVESGDLFSFQGFISILGNFLKARIFHKLKNLSIPYIIVGCNTGPFKTKLGKKLALYEMTAASVISVRDKESFNFVSQLDQSTNIYYFPDILLSSPISKPIITEENCLGISAYRSKDKTINYFSYKKLSEIADEYIEKTNGKVILFAFDVENQNDLSAALTIKSMSKHKDKIDIEGHLSDPIKFIHYLSRCSEMVSIRFHSAIMAMRLGIPSLPIIYSNKTDNLLNDLEYKGKRIYLDKIKDLNVKHTVDSLLNKDEILNNVDPRLFEEAKGHMKLISTFLNSEYTTTSKY